ncbi:T9SS type A sorting domain-containing protein [Oceanihabitans sp. IOP_32]|uniref:T9SS type A sorting domain-containing protein n=1 Tax=Oceanihabitans sp. IOP_32 TaxID=2529032 RepID=UPI00129407B4|nr:T9SS type A sorting domain-containing protein [Oceanihabitans sp. IOP_32]QFZ54939.1 T9SS type A sorting domain-containing protein [Oceanihabitans sp. IOP_32]
MKKILLFSVAILLSINFYGQESEFGLLFKIKRESSSTLPFGGHAGNLNYNIKNASTVIGTNAFTTNHTPNWVTDYSFYDFNMADNDVININLEGWSISINSPESCTKERTISYNKSDFSINTTGYFNGCIGVVDVYTLHLKQPKSNSVCHTKNIVLQYGYNWQYRLNNGSWKNFPQKYQEKRLIEFTLENLQNEIGSTIPLGNIDFRTGYENNFLGQVNYNVIGCPPEHRKTATTNTNCINSNDGSVTLTFDKNVDQANGYEMRYFIYKNTTNAATPQVAFQGTTDNPFPPQAYAEARFSPKSANNPYGLGYLNINPDNTSSGKYTGLEAGEYYILYQEVKYNGNLVVVKSGELIPDFFTIQSPTQVVLNTTSPNFFTDAKCGNPAVFQLNGTASGGNNLDSSGSYSYQYSTDNGTIWKPVEHANHRLEIPPTANQQIVQVKGVYNVNGEVCEGAFAQYTVSPAVEPLLITNPSTGNTSTTTTNNGSLSIEISGGKPPYTYTLRKLNTATNNFDVIQQTEQQSIIPGGIALSYNNLFAGTYNIIVTDNNNCSQNSPDLVVNTDAIPTLGTPVINQIDCIGGVGSISIPVSDFGTRYRYQWIINGVATAITHSSDTSVTLNNISATGSYVLRVASKRVSDSDFAIDANVARININMTSPALVKIDSANPNKTSCNGGTDGSMVLTLSGGTTYEYTLGHSPTVWMPLINHTISNLSAGSYTITVRNENGCASQPLNNIFIEEPDAITISEVPNSKQDVTTNGGSDGAIEITVSGGTAPYTFSWLGPNGYTSNQQNPTGLSTGDYSLTVTDANLCTQNFGPIFINEPGPLGIVSLNATPALCKATATGSIKAEITGTPPFIFTWTKVGDPTFTAPNQAETTGLATGTYTLSLTDASGSPAVSSSVFVSEPTDALFATQTTVPVSCTDGNNGQIIINPTGGTAPYTYSLNSSLDKQGSNTFANLTSGSYSVSVFDANNCEFIIPNAVVDNAPQIVIQEDLVLHISEFGKTDGAINTSVSGGNPPYTYSWTGPNNYTAAVKDINTLSQGFYTLTVTDANNCQTSKTFNITEPSELTVSLEQTVFLDCEGDDFAEIVVNVSGGAPNYTYQWFQLLNGSARELSETSAFLSNLSVGIYYAVVTDSNNVYKTTTSIEIKQPDTLKVELINKTDVLCSGASTGNINVAISGGTAPYKYYWNGKETTKNISNLPAGDYFFLVVDNNNCSAQLDVTIQAPANPLNIQEVILTNVSDYGANNGSISLKVTGGTPAYNFEWTRLSDNTIISSQATISNLMPDVYQVTITDANSCSLTQVYKITQPDIIEETLSNPTCAGNTDGSISLLVNKGNGNFTYSWSTGATTSTINNLAAGEYQVTVTGLEEPLTRTYTLENPLPIVVDLGADQVLCKDQNLRIDGTVENPNARYNWTSDNGFSSNDPSIVIGEKGTYTLTVSTQAGCSESDSIFVDVSDQEISAEFAVSSQIYVDETLVLVDISYPIPDSLEWIIPNEAKIIIENEDEAEIVFDTPGEYEIGIITKKGSCIDMQTKKIMVLAKDPTVEEKDTEDGNILIEDFLIYPNPNNGKFTAKVKLSEKGNISIKVFSFANNVMIAHEKARGELEYNIPFNISRMSAGVYVVLLETSYGSTLRKIILK